MKKWTKLFSLAIGALMAIGAAVGVKQTAERVNAAAALGELTAAKVTADCNLVDTVGKSWAVSSNGTYNSKANCIQVGSNSSEVTYLRLETSGYSALAVSKIQVWGTSKANTNVTPKVYIGENKLGEGSAYSTQNSDTGGTEFSVTNPSSYKGDIKIEISRPSSAKGAIYFNKLIVTYDNGAASIDVTDVELSKNSLELEYGASEQLSCTISPDNATNQDIVWSSSNESIATVDSTGLVTGVSDGQCIITATSDENEEIFDTCNVTVKPLVQLYAEADFGVGKFLITTTKSGTNYYLPAAATSSSPAAPTFTNVNLIDASNVWSISKAGDKYEIKNSEGDYLYITNSNTGVKVGSTKDSWTYTKSGTKSCLQSTNNNRYLGVYVSDWRSYDSSNATNYDGSGENLKFYRYLTDEVVIEVLGANTTYIDDTLELSLYQENVTEDIVWASSNTDVATISSDGVVTPVSIGTTQITASANDVTSDPFVVNVYPSITDNIDVSDAVEGAQLAGTTSSKDKFNVVGRVSSITGTGTFVLTDEDEETTIKVNCSSHGLTEENDLNRTIVVSGALRMNDSKPEIVNGTNLVKYWKVQFVSKSEKFGNAYYVKPNSLITNPGTPTNGGSLIFGGWFNGNVEWNFTSNVVTADLVLTAKWSNGIDTKSQLNIKYTYDEAVTGTNVLASLGWEDFEYSDQAGGYKNFTASVDGISFVGNSYSGNVTDGELIPNKKIQLKSSDNCSGICTVTSLGNISSISVEWNSSTSNGRTLNVYGSNSPYESPTDLYDEAKCGTSLGTIVYGTSTELADIISNSGNYSYIGIRSNSGALYLDSITINYDTSKPLTIKSISEYNLRFSCELTADQIASNFKTPADWQYGFMVAQTAQMKTTFEESYENLKNYFEISEDPIADVAAGAMMTGKNAKISTYVNAENPLPTPVGGKYEFSVNVTIPEANLSSSVSAVWFAYKTGTNEMVFASQKDMSIKDICGIYAGMGGLSESQQAAINYIAALAA